MIFFREYKGLFGISNIDGFLIIPFKVKTGIMETRKAIKE